MKAKIKITTILRAYWRFVRIILFYPLMIAAFFYVYIKGYHWVWGILILSAIICFDPTFRMIWRGVKQTAQARSNRAKK